MLGYVLPILTEAWPGKERGGEEAQNDLQFCPPFFGGAPHIYILRLVWGARPLESFKLSYGGPAPKMLGYVLPILTEAWPGKERGGEAQNDLQCRGLLPPIFGGAQICTPFF